MKSHRAHEYVAVYKSAFLYSNTHNQWTRESFELIVRSSNSLCKFCCKPQDILINHEISVTINQIPESFLALFIRSAECRDKWCCEFECVCARRARTSVSSVLCACVRVFLMSSHVIFGKRLFRTLRIIEGLLGLADLLPGNQMTLFKCGLKPILNRRQACLVVTCD